MFTTSSTDMDTDTDKDIDSDMLTILPQQQQHQYIDPTSNETNADYSWIDEFELNDKEYEQYYNDDVHSIKLHCVYINKESEIVQIKEEVVELTNPNIISCDEICGILNRRGINNGKKYTTHSILKYNIDIEPMGVKHFIKRNSNNTPSDSKSTPYLTIVENVDAIPIKKTIHMFQSLNDIFIFFYERSKPNSSSSPPSSIQHKTRRALIKMHKIGTRKQLKVRL